MFQCNLQPYIESKLAFPEVISPQFPEILNEDLITVVQRYKDIDAWAQTPFMTEDSFNRLMDVMDLAGELTAIAPYDILVDNSFANEVTK